ncbi:hypothetical protein NEMBOFW57_000744 [Staphylotrichum longicolle]|uniref:Ankyrin 2,3/unc44 n=1 Tax=Staphylotrichum longicolle TaxID=669026 RepID=A0AAD4EZY4_9PEZI|nr:hypothetical protein NEMBOFW57_000744 [Staphylotrichum longicolle]
MDRPKLRALDALSYSDSDFDRALRDIMPSSRNAVTYIDLQGWTELPEPDKLRVKDMIKNWMRSYKSHAVDLDQVNARLLKVSTSPVIPKQPQDTSTTITTPAEDEGEDGYLITEETAAYQDIVADGGRPWYPFHLFEHVRKHHAEHREMLRFWCSARDWTVYSKQRERWKSFRKWQDDNRGLLNVQAEFEKQKAAHLKYYARHGGDIDGLDTEKRWEDEFERFENRRGWEHHYTVEHGLSRKQDKDRFPAYVIAVRARLDRHGFARAVQLDPDPKNQDPLTTWIEYLNYEYWVHDGFVNKVTRVQSDRKQLLKTIAESGMLWPGETTEKIARFHYDFNLRAKHEKSKETAPKGSDVVDTKAQNADTQADVDREPRPVPETESPAQPCASPARKRARSEESLEKMEGPGLKKRKLEADVSVVKQHDGHVGRLALEEDDEGVSLDVAVGMDLNAPPPAVHLHGDKKKKKKGEADPEPEPVKEPEPEPELEVQREPADEAEVNREVAPEPEKLPETPAKSSQRIRKGKTQAAPADLPPLRRSAGIAALQERALREATAEEAVAKPTSTTVSKAAPRSKKRKVTKEKERPSGPQRKRRRTGR